MKFGDDYPCGPCPNNWKNYVCECGWKYNEKEVVSCNCEGECETRDYCGDDACPKCGAHLHCGGCV